MEESSDSDPGDEMPVEPDFPGEADEPEEAGTHQQPAAVRKLADYHTGEIPTMLPTRTRSGGLAALLSVALKAETAALETRKVEDAMATKAASTSNTTSSGTPSTAASSAWNTSTQESNTRTSSPKHWTQRRLRDMLVF